MADVQLFAIMILINFLNEVSQLFAGKPVFVCAALQHILPCL